MGRVRRKWTSEEDSTLRNAVEAATAQGRPLLWREFAEAVPGRTNKDCRRRWCNILADGISKGPWTDSEDDRLNAAVTRLGTKWTQIAAEVGTRNSDQCASHWTQSLSPDINYSDWSQEETELLLQGVRQYGTNWSSIKSTCLPNRTRLALKNRYSATQRWEQANTTELQMSRKDNELNDICTSEQSNRCSQRTTSSRTEESTEKHPGPEDTEKWTNPGKYMNDDVMWSLHTTRPVQDGGCDDSYQPQLSQPEQLWDTTFEPALDPSAQFHHLWSLDVKSSSGTIDPFFDSISTTAPLIQPISNSSRKDHCMLPWQNSSNVSGSVAETSLEAFDTALPALTNDNDSPISSLQSTISESLLDIQPIDQRTPAAQQDLRKVTPHLSSSSLEELSPRTKRKTADRTCKKLSALGETTPPESFQRTSIVVVCTQKHLGSVTAILAGLANNVELSIKKHKITSYQDFELDGSEGIRADEDNEGGTLQQISANMHCPIEDLGGTICSLSRLAKSVQTQIRQ